MSLYLEYNGVKLGISNTRLITRTNQYGPSGLDYECTEWIFDVIGIYNPSGTGENVAVSLDSAGAVVANQPPQTTDQGLLKTLKTPRAVLRWIVNGDVVLRAPAATYECDVRGGPFCDSANVVQVEGLTTWVVAVRIRTYINQCYPDDSATPNVLLSNRWVSDESLDEDYLSTRIIRGEATFNLAALLKAGTIADQYRQDLYIPTPNGFKRDSVKTTVDDTGTKVSYVIVDRQQHFNLGTNSKATRIEAYESCQYGQTGIFQSMSNAAISALRTAPLSTDTSNLVGIFREVVLGGIIDATPEYTRSVVVRAWGPRGTMRHELAKVCMGIVVARLARISAWLRTGMKATVDLTGRYVEIEMVQRTGLDELFTGIAAAVAGSGIAGAISYTEYTNALGVNVLGNDPVESLLKVAVPNNDDLFDPRAIGSAGPGSYRLRSEPGFGNPAPPNSRGTRGDWLGGLVAQAVSTPCGNPPRPPSSAGRTITDRTIPIT